MEAISSAQVPESQSRVSQQPLSRFLTDTTYQLPTVFSLGKMVPSSKKHKAQGVSPRLSPRTPSTNIWRAPLSKLPTPIRSRTPLRVLQTKNTLQSGFKSSTTPSSLNYFSHVAG